MDPKIAKKIQKLSDDLEKLKMLAQSQPPKPKTKERPVSIDLCTKKSELMMFTIIELKTWLISKKVDKLSKLNKEELVKLVKKKLKVLVVVQTEASSTAEQVDSEPEVVSHLDQVDDLIELSDQSDHSDQSLSPSLMAQIMKLIAESTKK
jgi:hypothetical protein